MYVCKVYAISHAMDLAIVLQCPQFYFIVTVYESLNATMHVDILQVLVECLSIRKRGSKLFCIRGSWVTLR